MGNACARPSITKTGIFQSVSAILRHAQPPEAIIAHANGEPVGGESSAAPAKTSTVQSKPLDAVKIQEEEKLSPQVEAKPANELPPPPPRKKLRHVKSTSSAGLLTDSVLRHKTANLKDIYSIARKLGQGQFGTTYLCVEKETGKEYACKSILKRKLMAEDDVEDVRREIQIMHHLSGHQNVISIKGAYEDAVAVHVVLELCAGGELFDRII